MISTSEHGSKRSAVRRTGLGIALLVTVLFVGAILVKWLGLLPTPLVE